MSHRTCIFPQHVPAGLVNLDDWCFGDRFGLWLSLGFCLGFSGVRLGVVCLCFGLRCCPLSLFRFLRFVRVLTFVSLRARACDEVSAGLLLIASCRGSGDYGGHGGVELFLQRRAIAVLP